MKRMRGLNIQELMHDDLTEIHFAVSGGDRFDGSCPRVVGVSKSCTVNIMGEVGGGERPNTYLSQSKLSDIIRMGDWTLFERGQGAEFGTEAGDGTGGLCRT
jgi:hypothetical protein